MPGYDSPDRPGYQHCWISFTAGVLPPKRLRQLQNTVKKWLSFKVPEKTNLENLVEHDKLTRDGYDVWACDEHHHRRRDGFALTDKRYSQRQSLYEIDHCIYCHDRNNDSCSKGIKNKKDGSFKANHLGAPMIGCPLEEKISEMHVVKRQGDNIGALALIIIDNPMCPGTGHRICNDCMRGCIYQKTEAGQYSANRNQCPDRCVVHALGLRDLQLADPLESA